MTTFKRNHKLLSDKKFKRGLLFYTCALIIVVITGMLALFLFPGKTKHQDSSISAPIVDDESPVGLPVYNNSNLEIPVLMYHYIRTVTDPNDTLGKNLSVTPETFEQQLSYLQNNGYESIDFDRALRLFGNQESIEKKPVIITFDDGYKDAYTTAMPALLKHNQIGIFYLISSFVQKNVQYLSFDDISGLIEHKMIIGCHTLDHPDLTTVNAARLKSELVDCKESLANVYSQPVADFCYPSGKYNPSVIEAVQAAGFKTAVTTKSGIWKATDGVYEIPRIRMTETINLSKILK
jgi:peptidoglycan/xylan/chitin deacetylase (PgdA/CDA1 family)